MKLPSLSEVVADIQPLICLFCLWWHSARQQEKQNHLFFLLYLTIEAFILTVGAEVSEFLASSRKLLVIQVKQCEASRSFWDGRISVVDRGFTHLWCDCSALTYLLF